jgi:hypothetical protein
MSLPFPGFLRLLAFRILLSFPPCVPVIGLPLPGGLPRGLPFGELT